MTKFINILIGGEQKNQSIKTDGICTCLCSSMGMGGGYVPMIVLADKSKVESRKSKVESRKYGTNGQKSCQSDEIIFYGNLNGKGIQGYAYSVYGTNGIAATITAVCGGGHEPFILVRA